MAKASQLPGESDSNQRLLRMYIAGLMEAMPPHVMLERRSIRSQVRASWGPVGLPSPPRVADGVLAGPYAFTHALYRRVL
jgi:hypothetical protein